MFDVEGLRCLEWPPPSLLQEPPLLFLGMATPLPPAAAHHKALASGVIPGSVRAAATMTPRALGSTKRNSVVSDTAHRALGSTKRNSVVSDTAHLILKRLHGGPLPRSMMQLPPKLKVRPPACRTQFLFSLPTAGRMYYSRSVLAKQQGKVVFMLAASFANREGASMSHQSTKPEVPDPERIPRLRALPAARSPHSSTCHAAQSPLVLPVFQSSVTCSVWVVWSAFPSERRPG